MINSVIRFFLGKKPMVVNVRNIQLGSYIPIVGSYGVYKPEGSIAWYKCREQYHSYFNIYYKKITKFLFICQKDKSSNVISFIKKLEDHFELVERSWFVDTNYQDIIEVNVSRWWIVDQMRHQFFTIAIRAGHSWVDNMSIKSCLLTNGYFLHTKEAMERFLEGYTRYLGTYVGWYGQFALGGNLKRKLTLNEINGYLVKPRYSEKGNEECLRKIAHEIWKKEGSPEGRDKQIWIKALEEFNEYPRI